MLSERSRLRSFCFVIALLLGSALLSHSQDVSSPIASLVGSYERGEPNYFIDLLTLKADGTFHVHRGTDTASQLVDASGTYSIQDKRLILQTADIKNERGMQWWKGRHELLMIPWGKRLYLMEEAELLDFCNHINLGYEPRGDWNGDYFLKFNHNESLPAVKGAPELPFQWQSYLLKKAVTGRVLSIRRTGKQEIFERVGGNVSAEIIAVTLDVGSQQGLKVGMCLRVPTTKAFAQKYLSDNESMVIRQVEAKQCVAEFSSFVPDTSIAVGAKATTRLEPYLVRIFQKIAKPEKFIK